MNDSEAVLGCFQNFFTSRFPEKFDCLSKVVVYLFQGLDMALDVLLNRVDNGDCFFNGDHRLSEHFIIVVYLALITVEASEFSQETHVPYFHLFVAEAFELG